MTTVLELRDLIQASALRHASLSGMIGEVSVSDQSVIIESRPLGLLRGFSGTPTALQVIPTESDVRIIILGGRSGIPVNQDLVRVPVAGRPLQQVADEVVSTAATYLANSAS